MAIVAKNKLVCEDIVTETGEVIGQIKFNPDDSKIMKTLGEVVCNLNNIVKKQDDYKNINLKKLNKNSSAEDFIEASKEIASIKDACDTEYENVQKSIACLKEIFGEECINCFTNETMDITALTPLIEFVTPYIENARRGKLDKYISKNTDVME